MSVQIQLRHDTAANWTSANPTLAAGEAGVETNTRKVKLGDGSTAWTSLAYTGGLTVDDEGSPLATTATTLDFVGAGVTASGTGATKTITIPGAGTATITAKDEGSTLSTGVTTLDFVGAGVTASGSGSTTTITIPGGGGGLWTPPDPLPTAPSAYDDTWSALSGWTTIGTLPTLNVTDRPGLLHMANPTPGTSNLHAIVKAAPTIPYVVATTGVFLAYAGQNSLDYGVILAEASGKFMIFGPATYSGPAWARSLWASATSRTNYDADGCPQSAVGMVPVYIRVVVTSATSVQTFYSFSGFSWTASHAAFDPGFTIGRVGLGLTDHDNEYPVDALFGPIRFALGTAGQTWNGSAWV